MSQSRTLVYEDFTDYFAELQRVITGVLIAIVILMSIYLNVEVIATSQPFTPALIVVPVLLSAVLFLLVNRIAVGFAANAAILVMAGTVMVAEIPIIVLGISAAVLMVSPFVTNTVVYRLTLVIVIGRAVILELPLFGATYSFADNLLVYLTFLTISSMLLHTFRVRLLRFISSFKDTAGLLSATVSVTGALRRFTTQDELLGNAITLIRERFGYYHVQVFLTEQNSNEALLTASTGAIGSSLVAENVSLPISARNVVGRALLAGEPIVVRAGLNRADLLFQDRLVNTASELVIPIFMGDKGVGVLDLHSTRPDAFTLEAVSSLQMMANALALALNNTRLMAQQSQSQRDSRQLVQENETNLRELERLNRQATRQAWGDYLRDAQVVNGVTLAEGQFRPGADWTQAMMQAVQQRQLVNDPTPAGNRQIALPIELRGEVVGAIQLELPPTAFLSETLDLLRVISERLAVNLDNARLFEEAQEATVQEQRVSEIVAGYQTADSMEALLQMTLQGLSDALGTDTSAIRLGNLTTPLLSGNGDRHD